MNLNNVFFGFVQVKEAVVPEVAVAAPALAAEEMAPWVWVLDSFN